MDKRTTYVAFLRGIGPGNPNMRNDKLKAAFESLGYGNVRSVISSGNIIFETSESDPRELEAAIESRLLSQLGIHSLTVIRTEQELRAFAKSQPFGDRIHKSASYLMVTFLKDRQAEFTHPPLLKDKDSGSELVAFDPRIRAVCYVVVMNAPHAPKFMAWLERHYSKRITGRTWKTIERVVTRL